MNRIKCSACGFVTFSTEEVCKKCKRSLHDPNAGSDPSVYTDSNTPAYAGSNTPAYAGSTANAYAGASASAGAYASPYAQSETEKSISWGSVGFGLFLIVVSFFLYSMFSELEEKGGSVRMNAIVILLYEIGGKWLASLAVGVVGLVITIAGFSGTSLDKEEN